MTKTSMSSGLGATVTRRDFIESAAGITFACALGVSPSREASADSASPSAQPFNVNAYVNIAPSGIVTVFTPSAEMGQGTMTALPLVLAEEMDVAWENVRILPSPAFGDAYGDPLFLNMIYSSASRAANIYFDRLRRFGAQARQVLILNAAEKLGVPAGELTTKIGTVIHSPSGQKLAYGEIAEFATVPESLLPLEELPLKDPSDFRLIGTPVPRRDLPDKVSGAARFSIDIELPGMVYAAVSRAPIDGATLIDVDDRAAQQSPGVVRILSGPHQVAVVAENYHQALQARSRLKIKWSDVENVAAHSSREAIENNARAARDLGVSGFPWDEFGSLEDAFQDDGTTFTREYRTDYMYHACMEPLNAVVWVQDGGARAEVWAGTQAPAYTVEAVARAAGIKVSAVTLHRTLLGGAFGRRSVHSMDFVTDAAWLSKILERPVKVIWSREDDISQGHYRPMTAQILRATMDDDGSISAWHHRVACEDPLEKFDPPLFNAWGKIPLITMLGAEHYAEDRSPIPYAYNLPNRLAEHIAVPAGIRVYAMRGVGAMPNKFAIESFIDELAQSKSIDPLTLRRRLLARSDRALRVLNTVAEMSNWQDRGKGFGLAYSHYSDSLVASVVAVSSDGDAGHINVDNVWIAADVGIVIQPDIVRAQLEGGAIFGLSNALQEELTIEGGVVKQTNFHQYQLMRMAAAPCISVRLVQSSERPTGVGEAGTIVTPAALANAIASLTGARMRHMPFTVDRVAAELAIG